MPRTATRPAANADPNQAIAFAPLTRADIEDQTDSGSFSRGRSYARGGRIFQAVRYGTTIQARCHGSSGGPYRVSATLATAGQTGEANPIDFSCTCPRGDFCKHIVALLLTWIDDPSAYEPRPAVAEVLAERSREELMALIEQMVDRVPDLESLLALPIVANGAPSKSPINEAAIRGLIASYTAGFQSESYGWNGEYYGYDEYAEYAGEYGVPSELERVVSLGSTYVQVGDWANGLKVLATFAEEIMPEFEQMLDEGGELIDLISQCDAELAAILDAQDTLSKTERLKPGERARLIDALFLIWQADAEAGGFEAVDAGIESLLQNTSPEEQRELSRLLYQMVGPPVSEHDPTGWRSRSALWFLSRLTGEAGLSGEQLLAEYQRAELWDEAATTMLELNRVDEAIALAARRLPHAQALTQFADQLIATGKPDRIQRALTFIDDCRWEREGKHPADDHALALWLERQYGAHGCPEKSLEMAHHRFQQQPSRQTYDAVRTAALLPDQPGEPWRELRPELIQDLGNRKEWLALIDIHLEEGEIAQALAALKRHGIDPNRALAWGGYFPGNYQERVARAAESEYPAEAIRIYEKLADQQIGLRKREHYQVAAGHLERVKNLLVAAGRENEWSDLITDLRQRHNKLRALRDELDTLGLA